MRAVLRCDTRFDIAGWIKVLGIRIAGRSLLERHLLAFLSAGVPEVVMLADNSQKALESFVQRNAPVGMQISFASCSEADHADRTDAELEVDAALLVDPRLIRDLAKTYADSPCDVVCADAYESNYHSEDKSPYRVGAASTGELEEAEQNHLPIGVAVRAAEARTISEIIRLKIGRYYWHKVNGNADVPEATRKIFLSTMKATDGIYARTNRRVSVPISHILVKTAITPNLVTLIALFCSLSAAWLYSLGTYWSMVAGAFGSWFASMMDGCDGEVARVKLQESEFGAWFEMVCDYLYYVVMFLGMGTGIAKYTGNPIWNYVGIGSVFGTIVSFVVIGRLKKRYSKMAPASDFGRAFQAKVGGRKSNPLHFFSRHVGFLITRAAMPYFIVIFTVLNIAPWIMGMILVGTNLAWFLALCAYPLFRPPILSRGDTISRFSIPGEQEVNTAD